MTNDDFSERKLKILIVLACFLAGWLCFNSAVGRPSHSHSRALSQTSSPEKQIPGRYLPFIGRAERRDALN
jgi:hypothetical protein